MSLALGGRDAHAWGEREERSFGERCRAEARPPGPTSEADLGDGEQGDDFGGRDGRALAGFGGFEMADFELAVELDEG